MPLDRHPARPALLLAALIALIALPVPAAAQDVRPESLRLYGGTYSPDCGSPQAPRLHVRADALVIEEGARKRTGRGVVDAYASFGGAPGSAVPEGFVVEFMSDAFSFHVFEDANGYYIRPAGYLPEAQPVIGERAMHLRFGRCP